MLGELSKRSQLLAFLVIVGSLVVLVIALKLLIGLFSLVFVKLILEKVYNAGDSKFIIMFLLNIIPLLLYVKITSISAVSGYNVIGVGPSTSFWSKLIPMKYEIHLVKTYSDAQDDVIEHNRVNNDEYNLSQIYPLVALISGAAFYVVILFILVGLLFGIISITDGSTGILVPFLALVFSYFTGIIFRFISLLEINKFYALTLTNQGILPSTIVKYLFIFVLVFVAIISPITAIMPIKLSFSILNAILFFGSILFLPIFTWMTCRKGFNSILNTYIQEIDKASGKFYS